MLQGMLCIGLVICKDMDFYDIGCVYVVCDVQLLLVLVWDFSIDGWLYGCMVIMCGVESGFVIVCVVCLGWFILSDDCGCVVVEVLSEQYDVELVGVLLLCDMYMLYVCWGNWFVWLVMVVFVVVLVLVVMLWYGNMLCFQWW